MAQISTNRLPFMAVHPCKGLKDEILARGMSIKEFAKRMDMQQSNISRLFRGEIDITLDMAKRLEKALDISAKTWIDLQLQYNEDKQAIAERNEEEDRVASIEKSLSGIINLPELYKRLSIRTTLFVQDKYNIVKEQLGTDLTDINQLSFNFAGDFKKSDKFKEDERNLRTWVLLAIHFAQLNNIENQYNIGNARKAASEISKQANCGDITEQYIKDTLNRYGIHYAVVPKLERTYIDAFSKQLDDNPCIVTTHRYDDMARLTFNVLHELGHIDLHIEKGEQKGFIASDSNYDSNDDREKEANAFAQDVLINPVIWKQMMNTKSAIGGANIVRTLKKLSKQYGVNYDILCWRYKHETKSYNIYGTKAQPIR